MPLLLPPPIPPTPAAVARPAPPMIGANLPAVGRYSKEADWAEAGGLAGWALKGKIVRVTALPWAAWPFGFDGEADLGYVRRQMEVCRGANGVLVLLSPSQFPRDKGEWIPKQSAWPDALKATKRLIDEYDAQAKEMGIPQVWYQLWNEPSKGKPGGAKTGAPGTWSLRLHRYMAYLTKELGLKAGIKNRFVGPAISSLTDAADARKGELATCSSPSGYWEARVSPAVHLRLPVKDGRPMTPEQYEPYALELLNRHGDTVRDLPGFKGRDVELWLTELYVTPGDLARPDLKPEHLDPWRQAVLRAALRSRYKAVIAWGLRPNDQDGDTPWLKYGGWAGTLSRFKLPQ